MVMVRLPACASILKGMQYHVTAVVVSYNRARLLDECLSALNAQTRRPDSLVIVDNASSILKGMQYHVTAVVVSYNRARLLDECLSALNAQTRRPDSLVIVDNASTDGALQARCLFRRLGAHAYL